MTTPKPESVTWKWLAAIAFALIGSMLSIGIALLVGVLTDMRKDLTKTMTDVAVIKSRLHVDEGVLSRAQ